MSTTTATFTAKQIETALEAGFEMAADESGVDVDNRDFEATRAAFWTYLQLTTATAQTAAPGAATTGATYTCDQVSTALNQAVDDMAERLHGGVADDIDNFTVNAVLTLLDTPDASFEDITLECYGEDADEVSRWLANAA